MKVIAVMQAAIRAETYVISYTSLPTLMSAVSLLLPLGCKGKANDCFHSSREKDESYILGRYYLFFNLQRNKDT